MTDTIADFLTRIRNAVMAKHRIVEVPTSKVKKEITKILFNKGYILSYKFDDESRTIKIALKYNPATRRSAITGIKRVSTHNGSVTAKHLQSCSVLNCLVYFPKLVGSSFYRLKAHSNLLSLHCHTSKTFDTSTE